jgi:hypothetical protein
VCLSYLATLGGAAYSVSTVKALEVRSYKSAAHGRLSAQRVAFSRLTKVMHAAIETHASIPSCFHLPSDAPMCATIEAKVNHAR